jgi:3-keto steroid reductase
MGICQSLLTNLSSAGAIPPAASLPSFTSVPPSLKPLLETDGGVRAARVAARIPEPHPTLTLVLACRSEKNAIEAREKLLEEHKKLLKLRRWRGDDVPEDWEQELRIEYELVDLDSVGGDKGVLSFSRRLAQRYPHVTSLYLNAGYASFTNIVIPKFLLQMVTHGFFHALHHPRYNIEEVGKRSADGERGMVWGVNVLAPYIIVSES